VFAFSSLSYIKEAVLLRRGKSQ